MVVLCSLKGKVDIGEQLTYWCAVLLPFVQFIRVWTLELSQPDTYCNLIM